MNSDNAWMLYALLAELKERRERAEKAVAEAELVSEAQFADFARRRELERERDEARAEVKRLREGMEVAWGVIANAGGGDWATQSAEWAQAAARWRDEHWHTALDRCRTTPLVTGPE
jgi:hypothetical protein